MKFDIRNFKDIKDIVSKNDLSSSLTSDDIINSIIDDVIGDAVKLYLTGGSKVLSKLTIGNFNTNYQSIRYAMNDCIGTINKVTAPDRMIKLKTLLKQEDLPDSIHIMGFKYTNVDENINIGYAFAYSLIPLLDDINNKLNSVVLYNEDDGMYTKNIQLETMIAELNRYVNQTNHKKKIIEAILNHRNYDGLKFNEKYFRNGDDKESDIIIKEDEYRKLYDDARGFREYRHVLLNYLGTYSKFHDVVLDAIDNRRVLKIYDALPKDEPFRRNIAKIFMIEGKLAFIYSKIINEMLMIQMKAMMSSMEQNTTAFNTIYQGRN